METKATPSKSSSPERRSILGHKREFTKAVTQEFHLSVTPVGADKYLVRTELVAPGVRLAEEQVEWPIDEWLNQAKHLLNDPLTGLLQSQDRHRYSSLYHSTADRDDFGDETIATASVPTSLVSLGQQLYAAIFQGTLHDSWMMAQAIANHSGEVLRLRLGLKDRRLARLPWEVMHAGGLNTVEGFRPLATGTDVVFCRYQPIFTGITPLETHRGPLKILMAIAAPTDRETLELQREARHLQAELQTPASANAPEIQLTILSQPDREQLAQALEQGDYQVFHYAGHSNLGASGGDIYLVSERTGLTEKLSGEDLAGLLVNNGIRMAVFNSCRGADAATAEWFDEDLGPSIGERNLAEALVRRGIPGVLAMAERIPDRVALTLSQLFYRNLKQGYPVDLSLSRARAGLITAYGSHQLYWALPILFLQPGFDGQLLATTQEEPQESVGEDSPETASYSLSETINHCLQQIAANPQDYEAYNLLGSALYQRAAVADAIAAYEKALQIHPNYADAHNNLGVVFYEQGRLADAIAAYQRALTLNPDHQSANENLTLALQHLEEDSVEVAPVVEAPTPPPVTPIPAQPPAARRWKWGLGLGILCSVILTFGLYRSLSQPPTAIEFPPVPATLGGDPNSSESITARASQHFRQGEIEAGIKDVEILLDREVLNFANAAIASVSDRQLDRPEISFLRGRIAWQAIQKGDPNYSLDDTRRFWEQAVRGDSTNLTYQNALGFAYYAEGELRRANQTWLRVLELAETQGSATSPSAEALTAYAGLALVSYEAAQAQPPAQRLEGLQRAQELYQLVLSTDPTRFSLEALGRNWLWTPTALQNWRSLSQSSGAG